MTLLCCIFTLNGVLCLGKLHSFVLFRGIHMISSCASHQSLRLTVGQKGVVQTVSEKMCTVYLYDEMREVSSIPVSYVKPVELVKGDKVHCISYSVVNDKTSLELMMLICLLTVELQLLSCVNRSDFFHKLW